MEDNAADVFLVRQVIQSSGIDADVQILRDGEKAIHFFKSADEDDQIVCPALVLLDINLPKKSGGEVLRHMRESRKCRDAPVIAVSTSDAPIDHEVMEGLGVDKYFRKPSTYSDFLKLGELIRNVLRAED